MKEGKSQREAVSIAFEIRKSLLNEIANRQIRTKEELKVRSKQESRLDKLDVKTMIIDNRIIAGSLHKPKARAERRKSLHSERRNISRGTERRFTFRSRK